jgi:hypothetical protein
MAVSTPGSRWTQRDRGQDVSFGLELQQAIVRSSWDGEIAPGMLERSIAIAELQ